MTSMFSRDERQKQIINVSRQLFTLYGVEKTSVADIIKELGIAKGTFYWYFESKEQLLHMVVADVINESYDLAEKICHLPKLSFAQKVARILEYLYINNNVGKDLEQCIQKEYAAFSDQIWQENIRQLTPIVKELVNQAIHEGLTNTACSDEVAAFIIYGFRSILFDNINENNEKVFEQVDRVIEFIFHGLDFNEPFPNIEWKINTQENSR